jgi:hypothetical protein
MASKKEAERGAKEKLHRRRDECTDRFLSLLQQGYNVDTLEGALELPYEELSNECERLEGVVARLKEIEAEVRRRGLASGNEGLLTRLHDVNALTEMEEYLASGKEPVEARPPADRIQIIRYGHAAPARETAEPARVSGAGRAEPKPPAARTIKDRPPEPAAVASEAAGKTPGPASEKPSPEDVRHVTEPARPVPEGGPAAPSLAAAVARAEPPHVREPAPVPPLAASAPSSSGLKCEGCGEPVDANWKKCPSCLRPLGSSGGKPAAPTQDKPATIDRIPARPERDLGIRDESTPDQKARGRRETPIDPGKLAALRKMIDQRKSQGEDIGDLEIYLNSGVVTKEGMRIRLEAINERIKKAGAPEAPALDAPPGDAETKAPAPEEAEGEEALPETDATESRAEPEAPIGKPPAGPEPNGKQPADGNGDGGNGGLAGDGVRKIKKVKKVVK